MSYHATSFTAEHVHISRLNEPDDHMPATAQIRVHDQVTMFVDSVADCDALLAALTEARRFLHAETPDDAPLPENADGLPDDAEG